MSSGGSKNWLIAIGAAVAVVGAAVVFHLVSNKESAEGNGLNEALTEIQALGEPKRDPTGRLAFNYYKQVFFIIMKHARQSFAAEKAELLKKRRELLKAGKNEEYKNLVGEMIQKEERVGAELLQEAMENIGLSEQEFMTTHQHYMYNPQTQQELMQGQMAAPAKGKAPTLSKQKTKEIFLDSEEKKFESMKAMMQNQKGPMNTQEDQMEAMVEMMVQQAILADDMFEKHGVEEEEFNSAVMHYQLMNDPEVYKKMMESMQKLNVMSGGQMGAMGGMGGMGMM